MRLFKEEGVDNVRQSIGLMRCDVHVGYWHVTHGGKLNVHRDNFNNNQWDIALQKVKYP